MAELKGFAKGFAAQALRAANPKTVKSAAQGLRKAFGSSKKKKKKKR